MSRSAVLATLIGLVLAGTLLATNDLHAILAALGAAGWGILLVIALHLPQTFFSALGWRALVEGETATGFAYRLRWIRESVNTLLPVAQLGGDVIRVRLLAARGVATRTAAAATTVDLSVEMATQAIFTLVCIALLLAGPHLGAAGPIAWGSLGGILLIALLLIGAQRLGLLRLIERLVARGRGRWASLGDLAGFHDAAMRLYRDPRRLFSSSFWHLASWFAGGLETWAALHVLGVEAGLREAIVMEGLGQAVRAAGFLIPGALGVQEGGFVLIGALLGITPSQALALSLLRRARELALGLPGLALWHRSETQPRHPAGELA